MKYAWIERHRAQWPVSLSCEVLRVSASGYHEHRRRSSNPHPRRLGNDALMVHIRAVHAQSKGDYGWPRVWKQLLAQDIRVGKERVRKLMQQHGIRAGGKRKFKGRRGSGTNALLADSSRVLAQAHCLSLGAETHSTHPVRALRVAKCSWRGNFESKEEGNVRLQFIWKRR